MVKKYKPSKIILLLYFGGFMKDFAINITCQCCCSNNVHIFKHIDFTGLGDCPEHTGNIVLVCQECNNKKVIKPRAGIIQ